jgi:replicative DNA helicase
MARPEMLRTPPHANDAEESVLGALMIDEGALSKVSDWLHESDFYRADHRAMFKAIIDLNAQGKPHDNVTLAEWFEANAPEIDTGYVLKMGAAVPSAANIVAYGEIVREKAKLRELIDIGSAITSEAFDRTGNASVIASKAATLVSSMVGDSRVGGLSPVKTVLASWWADMHARYERGIEMTGVTTPWLDLDNATLGFQPEELTIIAGRTSNGKSVMGHCAAAFCALTQGAAAIFSLEMSGKSIVERLVSEMTGIKHATIRRPKLLSDDEWPLITKAMCALNAAPLHIDDQAQITVDQIIARAKREHLRHPLKMVVVDHLGEIKRTGPESAKVSELGDINRKLKALAKELKIPVVLLVQLNRKMLDVLRGEVRPNLGDLRGSGEIEEVGDVILFIHREEVYKPDTHLKGYAEIIFGKGRNIGTNHSVFLEAHYDLMQLRTLSGPLPLPPPPVIPKRGLRKKAAAATADLPLQERAF